MEGGARDVREVENPLSEQGERMTPDAEEDGTQRKGGRGGEGEHPKGRRMT